MAQNQSYMNHIQNIMKEKYQDQIKVNKLQFIHQIFSEFIIARDTTTDLFIDGAARTNGVNENEYAKKPVISSFAADPLQIAICFVNEKGPGILNLSAGIELIAGGLVEKAFDKIFSDPSLVDYQIIIPALWVVEMDAKSRQFQRLQAHVEGLFKVSKTNTPFFSSSEAMNKSNKNFDSVFQLEEEDLLLAANLQNYYKSNVFFSVAKYLDSLTKLHKIKPENIIANNAITLNNPDIHSKLRWCFDANGDEYTYTNPTWGIKGYRHSKPAASLSANMLLAEIN